MESIVVLGEDSRMEFVGRYLYHTGHEVSRDIGDLKEATCLILSPIIDKLLLNTINSKEIEHKQVFYGKCPEFLLNRLLVDNICESYLTWEPLIKENALLTARGIIKEAYNESLVLKESRCLVAGFGACGYALANELKKQGAHVDVMVRRKELKSSIENAGYGFVWMNQKYEYDYIKYSYVFNTVPALIFDNILLARFSSGTYIFDIASRPGGVDFDYCKSHNLKASLHLGIPGRLFPEEAGNIIGENIAFHLQDSDSSLL